MTKKIVAVILALIIALPSMIFASAAEIPTITVSSASAAPGDTVTLNVELANNPGISAFSLGFEYDEKSLKYEIFNTNQKIHFIICKGDFYDKTIYRCHSRLRKPWRNVYEVYAHDPRKI